MIVAVPLELVASPLRSGRGLGEADRSALVVGGTERVRAGGAVVFCKVVAVAEAQVKRDGQVRAKGSPVHHATLGPLEERLEPGAVGEVAGSARLDGRLVKGERERLLARAVMVRVIVAGAGGVGAVGRGRAGRARPGPAGGAAGPCAGRGLAGAPGGRLPRRGHHREGGAAAGGGAGRDADPGAGHAREQGVLRVRRHRG
jgi:hypothetical protein